jgi:single stranded DNA-binding protein
MESIVKSIKSWPDNLVELCGYAAKDPEYKRYAENKIKANFTLGTHRLFRNKKGRWERTTVWHTVVLWNYQALKAIEMVKRGSYISLSGRLRSCEITFSNGKKERQIYILATSITVNTAT